MKQTAIPTTIQTQRGATLIVVLITVALLALLAVYGVGISVMDQRSSANEFRAKEAAFAAESGIEQALSYLSLNRASISTWTDWANCSDTSAIPCSTVAVASDVTNWKYRTVPAGQLVAPDLGSHTVYLMTPKDGSNKGLLFQVVAVGASEDNTASSMLKHGAYFYPLIVGNPNSPLMSASNIPLSGNYSIVGNPNAGLDSDKPLFVSAWSNAAITPGGSFGSCQRDEYFASGASYTVTNSDGTTYKDCNNCACPTGTDNGWSDIVASDSTNFPDDLFEFMFGVPEADYQEIRNQITVASDCSGLGTASSGLYWITGNCNPPDDVGSYGNPVLVVVQGTTTLNAGTRFYGMLYAFDPAGGTPTLRANGNAIVYGAVIAHSSIDLDLAGGFVLFYDAVVLDNLRNNPSSRGLSKIPGSWADF